MKNKLLGIGIVLLLGMAGCYNDKADQLYITPLTVTCDTSSVSYTKDIVPIFATTCNISGGCHDAAGKAISGYDFTGYAGVQPIASTNVLIKDINWAPGHNAMPKNLAKLSICDINKVTAWVNKGAPNN
jgi:hypothetical protein